MKQLAGTVDQLSKRLVKDTTVWNNKKESLEAELAAAQQVRPTVVAGLVAACWRRGRGQPSSRLCVLGYDPEKTQAVFGHPGMTGQLPCRGAHRLVLKYASAMAN